MYFLINGEHHKAIAIKTFRIAHSLPDTFGVALFEPKDFTGLARIDKAGTEMNDLRNGILNAVPETITMMDALTVVDTLQAVFRNGLIGINTIIGLKVDEVEFAVSGFGDCLQQWMYTLIRAKSSKSESPDFQQVYRDWVNGSTRLSQQNHIYTHQNAEWHVNIINNVYGRVGLQVKRGDNVDYVHDSVYTCPAEGYMATLLTDLAGLMATKLLNST